MRLPSDESELVAPPEEAQQTDREVQPKRRMRAVLVVPLWQARRRGRDQLPQAAGGILLRNVYLQSCGSWVWTPRF